jgi:hypothetical protein
LVGVKGQGSEGRGTDLYWGPRSEIKFQSREVVLSWPSLSQFSVSLEQTNVYPCGSQKAINDQTAFPHPRATLVPTFLISGHNILPSSLPSPGPHKFDEKASLPWPNWKWCRHNLPQNQGQVPDLGVGAPPKLWRVSCKFIFIKIEIQSKHGFKTHVAPTTTTFSGWNTLNNRKTRSQPKYHQGML